MYVTIHWEIKRLLPNTQFFVCKTWIASGEYLIFRLVLQQLLYTLKRLDPQKDWILKIIFLRVPLMTIVKTKRPHTLSSDRFLDILCSSQEKDGQNFQE